MADRLVLVGLGNPDAAYAGTRHNLGRDVLRVCESGGVAPAGALFFYPPVHMNESGAAVAAFMQYHRVSPEQLLVAHDDLELALGAARLDFGGSARGHNGVRSVQAALGTQDFYRLRLGVGRPPDGAAAREFVLGRFSAAETEQIEKLARQAPALLNSFTGADAAE